MTIQHRTYSAKTLDYIDQSKAVIKSGVSVYRESNHGQLDEVFDQIDGSCSGYIISKRGEGSEIPSAVNILETKEARKILSLGNLASQNIVDYLYKNVPSLHKMIKAETDSVELFGWENSANRVIGVTFKDPELSEILQERCDVIDNLNELSHSSTSEYCYIRRKTPHVSLVRINPNIPQDVLDNTLGAIRETLPAKLILKRAVIYDPSQKFN